LIPGSVAELLWPAFARAASIDASRVRVVGVDFRTYGQLFAAGQTDATNSVVGHHENVTLARQGRPVGDLLYADHLPMIGLGVVTSARTLAERPDLVRAFMRGTRRGWDHLLQSPREAVTEAARIVRREVAGAPDEDVLIEAFLQVIPQFMKPNPSENKPPGWSNPEAWKRLVSVLQEHDRLPRSPGVDELMTNRFVE
jgi:ABC-type nitrate/sulfonate/bicarbonate transport system substrate-binding protein